MPDQSSSFLQETASALRGVWALVVGDRSAASYFDLGQRGLVTSFLALILMIALQLGVSMALGFSEPGGHARSVLQTALAYAGIAAASSLLLRALGRQDAFVPYLVTLNWSNVLFSALILVIALIGVAPAIYVVMVAAVIVSVNIARLIMTLRPGQIAMLILVQVIGFFAGLVLLSLVLPLTPEQLAELTAAAGSPRL